MQIDRLETSDGQVAFQRVNGRWEEASPSPVPARAGAGAAKPRPSLSLSHNCDGKSDENEPKPRSASKIARAKETLHLNVKAAVQAWGLRNVGLLTLTFREHLNGGNPDHWRIAKDRVRNLRDGVLRKLFRGGVVVWEEAPDTRRIHCHLVVGAFADLRGNLDFEAVKRRDYRTASPELRRLWAILREKCPAYRLGRHELLPVRDGNAIGRYVAGYLGEDFDGSLCGRVRRVSYFGESVRVATMQAGWVNGAGAAFRHLLREMEFQSNGGLSKWVRAIGPRWAYRVYQAWRREGDFGFGMEPGTVPLGLIAANVCAILHIPILRPARPSAAPVVADLDKVSRRVCEAFGGAVLLASDGLSPEIDAAQVDVALAEWVGASGDITCAPLMTGGGCDAGGQSRGRDAAVQLALLPVLPS